MPLLLSNEEVTRVLSMADCMEPMETAFRELGDGQAVTRPRSDLVVPQADPARHYLLKTCDAALPGVGLSAVRITSNMMQESSGAGSRRLDPLPLAGGGKGYVGLVLLFDMHTLELTGIIHDARIQVMRAGAAHGIAAKFLAREDAQVMGILGSGNHAREQLSAIALVRKLRKVKVYSPTRTNRERFVREMSDRLGLDIIGCDTPREVVKDADIVAATTTSLVPLFPGDWLEPGQHVSAVRATEMDDLARARAALLVLQSGEQSLLWTPASQRGDQGSWYQARDREIDKKRLATLPDIVAGRHAGRTAREQITLLGGYASFGPGTGYAALGAIALRRARERGLGRELPAEWFIQKESS
jgi:ornithine cyclodeaminase/alanine dehydrogenase-like protein (mu-crystallin family)